MFASTIRSLIGRPPSASAAVATCPRTIASAIRAARTLAADIVDADDVDARRRSPSAVVASVASSRSSAGRSRTRPRVDLRLVPSRIGRPSVAQVASSRSSSRFWSGVLPNPNPGSTMRSSQATPSRDRPLERGSQVGDDLGARVRVARLGAVVHHDERDAASAARRGERIVVADAPDVVDQVGAGGQRGLRDRGLGRVDADGHVRQGRADGGDDRHDASRLLGGSRARGPAGSTRHRCRAGRRPRRPSGAPGRRPRRPGRRPAPTVGEQAVAGERVGGDVEDAHHERPLAPAERRRADPRSEAAGRHGVSRRVIGRWSSAGLLGIAQAPGRRPAVAADRTDEIERAGHHERAASGRGRRSRAADGVGLDRRSWPRQERGASGRQVCGGQRTRDVEAGAMTARRRAAPRRAPRPCRRRPCRPSTPEQGQPARRRGMGAGRRGRRRGPRRRPGCGPRPAARRGRRRSSSSRRPGQRAVA